MVHDADQRLDINAVARFAKDPAQSAKAQRFSEFAQSPDVTQSAGRFEFNRRRGLVQEIPPRSNFRQTGNHRAEAVGQLIESGQRNQGPMFGLAGIVTEGFDELEILARTGAGDLEEHASTLPAIYRLSNIAMERQGVPLHNFLGNRPETRMATFKIGQKSLLFALRCRTRVSWRNHRNSAHRIAIARPPEQEINTWLR